MLRNYKTDNVRVTKENTYVYLVDVFYWSLITKLIQTPRYKFKRGTTAWKHENIRSLVVDEVVRPVGGDAMDTT